MFAGEYAALSWASWVRKGWVRKCNMPDAVRSTGSKSPKLRNWAWRAAEASGSLTGVPSTYLRRDHVTGDRLRLIGGADNVENCINHDRLVGTCLARQQLVLLSQLNMRFSERCTRRARSASSGWDSGDHRGRRSSVDTGLGNNDNKTKNEEAEDEPHGEDA